MIRAANQCGILHTPRARTHRVHRSYAEFVGRVRIKTYSSNRCRSRGRMRDTPPIDTAYLAVFDCVVRDSRTAVGHRCSPRHINRS